jgi:hypothetical protein
MIISMRWVDDEQTNPCAAADPAIASRLQSNALVGRVAELGSMLNKARGGAR